MTDHVRQLIVTLDKDYRIDDALPLIKLLECIKGVAGVSPHINTLSDVMARETVRRELEHKMYEAVQQVFRPDKG